MASFNHGRFMRIIFILALLYGFFPAFFSIHFQKLHPIENASAQVGDDGGGAEEEGAGPGGGVHGSEAEAAPEGGQGAEAAVPGAPPASPGSNGGPSMGPAPGGGLGGSGFTVGTGIVTPKEDKSVESAEAAPENSEEELPSGVSETPPTNKKNSGPDAGPAATADDKPIAGSKAGKAGTKKEEAPESLETGPRDSVNSKPSGSENGKESGPETGSSAAPSAESALGDEEEFPGGAGLEGSKGPGAPDATNKDAVDLREGRNRESAGGNGNDSSQSNSGIGSKDVKGVEGGASEFESDPTDQRASPVSKNQRDGLKSGKMGGGEQDSPSEEGGEGEENSEIAKNGMKKSGQKSDLEKVETKFKNEGQDGSGSQLLKVDFYQKNETSFLELTFNNSTVKANKFHVTQDKQIIVDLKGVTASKRVMRQFDTSEFSGAVVFVSPYKKLGTDDEIRVALQLRDNVRSILERKDDKIILAIENRFGVFSQKNIDKMRVEEDSLAFGKGGKGVKVPKSKEVIDVLENLTLSGEKKYVGKKISVNVKDVEVINLLKMIADTSGFNIILSDEVNAVPPLTLALANTPWDQVLDTILDLAKLVAKKNGNILTITTVAKDAAEKKILAEVKASNLKQDPLVTRIFPLSFAELGSMSTLLKKYSTPTRGDISQDSRTNSLIVKDTVEVIERMKKIIETLDTQTPQILIESKIVEANEKYAKQMGLTNGVNFGYDPITTGLQSAPQVGPGFVFSSAPTAATGMLDLKIGALSRLLKLDTVLQLMESEAKGKIISSPKVIAENKKVATIESTESISFPIATLTAAGTTTTYQQLSVTLRLKVTPQVTNEGSIAMLIDLEKGSFAPVAAGTNPPPPTTTKRKLTTNVLVDNGSTIVLGGIYLFDTSESHSGVPFLKDLPVLGWLFRTMYNPTENKSELIIFLTPRIINQEEAGLVSKAEESAG
jgi:type IV pilus assembly protein PilQ